MTPVLWYLTTFAPAILLVWACILGSEARRDNERRK